jgi:PEP-CTERM motif
VACAPAMQAVPLVGSFSYASTLSGVIGLSDLRSFEVLLTVTDSSVPVSVNSTQSRQFDLADMRAFEADVMADPQAGFLHFAWDATQQAFVEGHAGPGWSNEGTHILHFLAGVTRVPAFEGFRVDRLPPQGSGLNQTVTLFTAVPGDVLTGRSFIQQYNQLSLQVSSVPEPSAYLLGGIGLGGLCWLARSRRARRAAQTVSI